MRARRVTLQDIIKANNKGRTMQIQEEKSRKAQKKNLILKRLQGGESAHGDQSFVKPLMDHKAQQNSQAAALNS